MRVLAAEGMTQLAIAGAVQERRSIPVSHVTVQAEQEAIERRLCS